MQLVLLCRGDLACKIAYDAVSCVSNHICNLFCCAGVIWLARLPMMLYHVYLTIYVTCFVVQG